MIPYLRNPTPCVQKLDRLDWADGVSLEAYGARIGVRVTHREVMDDIRRGFPPGSRTIESAEVEDLVSYQVGGPGARPGLKKLHVVYSESLRVARTESRDEALHAIESWMQLGVALKAKQRVFVHAGAVAWRGRAIVLPGRSFAGKSTLVAALLRAGASYFSDEYAVLDAQGLVHAYPRRLSLRTAEGTLRERPTAEDLNSRTEAGPLPIALVVVARYRAGSEWRPRSLSPSLATLAMFENTVAAAHEPERCLSAIRQAAAQSVCVKGWRGEADRTADQILAACDQAA